MTDTHLNPQQIADAVALGMMAKDRASTGPGLRVTHISPGSAEMAMRVRDDMLNGFDICHGGSMTLQAASAFAFACNAYNELTVASSLNIDFIAPVRGGDMLSARAALMVKLQRKPSKAGEGRMARNFALETHEVAAGYVLTCKSHPLTERVVISFNER